MSKHETKVEIPSAALNLKTTPITFKVYRGGSIVGTLAVSNAKVEWFAKKAKKTTAKKSWAEIAEWMSSGE